MVAAVASRTADSGSTGDSLVCPGCGAVVDVAAGQGAAICVYCATPGVVSRPRGHGTIEPALITPFVVGREEAMAAAKRWQRSRSIFAHGGVKHAHIENLRGVYVPAWLYSCVARSSYTARIGENYTVTETYTTTENGKTVTRTRQVTKTEWRSLDGEHAQYVSDVIVTASKGVPNNELERVEPFDLRGLRRYDAAAVVGWLMEEPSVTRSAGLEMARGETTAHTAKTLSAFMPGDTHSDLKFNTSFENESADPMLVPLWVLAVRYDAKKPALRVLVNGTTKKVGGDTPWSAPKIVAAVVVVVGIIAGVVALGFRLGWFK
ncbi:MAG: hypothetical protein Q8O67_12635 [Deltaproteobacteria bacterium]|nr:hypothetical protein [Deltaproteobacteria bacterium]